MSSQAAVVTFLDSLSRQGIRFRLEGGRLHCMAPPGVVTSEISEAIAERKAAIAAFLAGEQPTLARENRRVPLSQGAQSHWLMQRLNPGRTQAVLVCSRIAKPLSPDTLKAAWQATQYHHGLLMATVAETADGFDYVVASEPSPLEYVEGVLEDGTPLVATLEAWADKSFDLDGGPLARAVCYRLDDGSHVLLVAVHHVIFDGYSASNLLKVLFESYVRLAEAPSQSLAARPIAFREFVESERAMLASAEGEKLRTFWAKRLADVESSVQLGDGTSVTATSKGHLLVRRIPDSLGAAVEAFSRAVRVQPAGVFLAAYQWLLHRHARQEQIAMLMPVNVRRSAAEAAEIGFYFNVVPLVSVIDRDATVADWVMQAQAGMADAAFHAAYPFPLMRFSQNAVYNVFFGFHDFANLRDVAFAQVVDTFGLSPVEGFHARPQGDNDLALEIFRDASGYRVELQSLPERISPIRQDAFLERYVAFLGEMVASPDASMSAIPWIGPDDVKRLAQFNATAYPFPHERCIHDVFVDQVMKSPDAAAVRFRSTSLNYADYAGQTARMANYIRAQGLGRDDIVAICMDRSIELTVAIMGTLRAGAAYMPIDAAYPDDRVRYMLEDSGTRLLLTQASMVPRLTQLASAGCLVSALDDPRDILASAAADDLPKVDPASLAYVMYTSGSTGKPKGVLVEHRALMNRLHWMQRRFPLAPGDVVLQKTPYCFDVSVWEFLWTPATGATLLVAEPDGHLDAHYLERTMQEGGVTTLHFVPSMFNVYLDNARGQADSVKTIFCSGEALDRATAARYRARFPHAHLHNLYGPTEAAIDVTAYACDDDGAYRFVPIGKPIDNTAIHILDDAGQVVAPGAPGELYIAGANVARGYLNRPELSAEKFVPDPFQGEGKMYRTGDLARWLNDGNIQYLGRIDSLVKIGGVRIEPGEVEACLNTYPGIGEAVVVPTTSDGTTQLIAFYRASASDDDELVSLPTESLRAHMLAALPEYMVPAAFIAVARIPVTSNGKADRSLLASTAVEICPAEKAYRPPSSETERVLASLWADVFKARGFVVDVERLGVDDNFFDLGGNSVMATQVLYRVRETFDVEMPVQSIFSEVTIARLAAYLDRMVEQTRVT